MSKEAVDPIDTEATSATEHERSVDPDESGPHPLYEAAPRHRERSKEDVEARLTRAQELANAIQVGLRSVIFGQDETLEHVTTCLLAGGHVLLEGAPGLGKTQIVRTLSTLLSGRFARVQFTPDLMPSDVLGTSLVVSLPNGSKDLQYREGPVFTNLLLADEINRATPKTQSALLEAMGERTVSVDGVSRPLPRPFFVLATENPIEMEGVFPLPEAQLDRFLMKLVLKMPDLSTLTAIAARAEEPDLPCAVTTPHDLEATQAIAREIPSAPHVLSFAARLVLATHQIEGARYGAGPRAVQALMSCARARALMVGRACTSIADIKAVAVPVLRHRVALGFEAEAMGVSVEQALAGLLQVVPDAEPKNASGS